MIRKRLMMWFVVGIGGLVVILFFLIAAFSVSPPRTKQELCLKNIRGHLLTVGGTSTREEEEMGVSLGTVGDILEIPFFQERSPEHFREIQEEMSPKKGIGIIVVNPHYVQNKRGWIAMYCGCDFESRLKGYLILDDRGKISRTRKEKVPTDVPGLRYYLHIIEGPDGNI